MGFIEIVNAEASIGGFILENVIRLEEFSYGVGKDGILGFSFTVLFDAMCIDSSTSLPQIPACFPRVYSNGVRRAEGVHTAYSAATPKELANC